jgi:mono/diheme cytochrome c family protein
MKKVFKALGVIVLVLVLIIIGTAVYVQFGYDKRYNATPYPDIHATKDSATIAWGKYLVYGPAHCAVCHAANGMQMEVDAGKEVPLVGGWELKIPPGTFRSRNLTSDKETGIGALTDGEIARTLRYNVNHLGRVILPVMPFQDMSDYDMTAVISYIRTLAPVRHEVQPSELTFLGKAVYLFTFRPRIPETPPVKKVDRDSSVAYGKYLATCVANCYGCHTDRDLKTGEFTGKPFAGGFHMPPDSNSNGYAFITPNLTPDRETGRISDWSEVAFVNRFRQGRVNAGSPMPWGPFSRMDDLEIKAVYRYLQTVDPVKNKIDKMVFAPNEIPTMPPARNWKD